MPSPKSRDYELLQYRYIKSTEVRVLDNDVMNELSVCRMRRVRSGLNFIPTTNAISVTRNKVGIMAIYRKGMRYVIGWSLCNPKDTFNKGTALKVAKERAIKLYTENPKREIGDIGIKDIPVKYKESVYKILVELIKSTVIPRENFK